MAAIDFHTPASIFSNLGHRVMHLPAQLAQSLRDRNRTRHTRRELLRLSDRELSDIGLTRELVSKMNAGTKDF
ncbi:MAG: DUF1127 domain-containing protein [Albidovulum sp.]|nr:DUF1127 domain-containing protein [Albidovulum sp.]MDE0304282.1 DUF1127 domain-containing protein [Albidovulum sp.]MDE0531569.1 DUF1127 domain-containing protein [Albidovulum sp.]